jgi:NADH dehydrogenase FAD-containing subunit
MKNRFLNALLSDLTENDSRILNAFEIAETTSDPALQKAAMTFVIIGAGPTGVEMAGAISELANRTLIADFRNIQSNTVRTGKGGLARCCTQGSAHVRRELVRRGTQAITEVGNRGESWNQSARCDSGRSSAGE